VADPERPDEPAAPNAAAAPLPFPDQPLAGERLRDELVPERERSSTKTVRPALAKVGRNQPSTCGSGKK
jgi:hypothetical protein